MSNHDFVLKSGETLHVSTPSFEVSIELIEAIKRATVGMNPSLEIDSVVLSNPEVRKALFQCFKWSLWGVHQVGVSLFDDVQNGDKAKSDYFEICSRVIEVVSKPFFLNLRSASTTTSQETSGSQK